MMKDLKLNLDVDRFRNRKELLAGFAGVNASIDKSIITDTFTEEAFGVLTSSALVDAIDISKEDPKIKGEAADKISSVLDEFSADFA